MHQQDEGQRLCLIDEFSDKASGKTLTDYINVAIFKEHFKSIPEYIQALSQVIHLSSKYAQQTDQQRTTIIQLVYDECMIYKLEDIIVSHSIRCGRYC